MRSLVHVYDRGEAAILVRSEDSVARSLFNLFLKCSAAGDNSALGRIQSETSLTLGQVTAGRPSERAKTFARIYMCCLLCNTERIQRTSPPRAWLTPPIARHRLGELQTFLPQKKLDPSKPILLANERSIVASFGLTRSGIRSPPSKRKEKVKSL